MRQEIDTLDEHTDAQVAHFLNERGRRTGAGDAFDPANVRWFRFSAQLKSLRQRLLDVGMPIQPRLSAQLGVSRTTLGRWRQEGLASPAREFLLSPKSPLE